MGQDVAMSYYSRVLGVELGDSHESPIIAPGSKLILYAAQLAVKGDLLLPVPSWVSYAPQQRCWGKPS